MAQMHAVPNGTTDGHYEGRDERTGLVIRVTDAAMSAASGREQTAFLNTQTAATYADIDGEAWEAALQRPYDTDYWIERAG